MPMIPDDEIDRIKRETDLAAVIRSRGVKLKPAGHDLVGLCPFHETTSISAGDAGQGLVAVHELRGDGQRDPVRAALRRRFLPARLRALEVGQALGAVRTGERRASEKVHRAAAGLARLRPDADDQAALRQVLDYYHAALEGESGRARVSPKTRHQKRGGDRRPSRSASSIARWACGCPTDQRKEGAAIRERLTRLGLLRDTGHEHLRGRIVFPVVAENGEIGTVYGRAIDERGKHDRHLFLPGAATRHLESGRAQSARR